MHSIRTRITAITAGVIMLAMLIATVFGVVAIKDIGKHSAEQTLLLLCETGQKNLNHYFTSVEQSVEMISAYVEADLDGLDDARLQAHLDRVCNIFTRLSYKTSGVLTYYYRIDPSVSDTVKGFWYVNLDGDGFKAHDVTNISLYDTEDTSGLVWYTVPRATGKGTWLPPYVTDNLNVRVISYNQPVFYQGLFIGVIGIEIDYSTMANEVNNLTLYESGYAFLNDEAGNIIYHPHIDVASVGQPSPPEGIRSDDRFIFYTFEGVEKQGVWLPLSNGMHLNVSVPVREINADWQIWVKKVIAVFAVVLAAFVALIVAFSHSITRPLQKLAAAAEQIDDGNYDIDLDMDRRDEVGVLTRTILKVISNLKHSIHELNHLAYIDALTGIRNRMALRQDYDTYLGHDVTVMMADLNDFKIINDTRGHEEGDRILRETGRLLADTFGAEHCYRYGGDEFLVIVPDMEEAAFKEKLDAMMHARPRIDETDAVGLSVGYAHGALDKSDRLRNLISAADEKMYEVKRDKGRQTAQLPEIPRPPMKESEYTVEELRTFLNDMSGRYDLARVVDPVECRILDFMADGRVTMNERCYGIWNSEQKCINCSSALACRTGCHQEKAEHFQDQDYFIQSNPVKLRLTDGSVYNAVVELVNVRQNSDVAANNREAENIGTRASHYLAHHDSLTNVLNADAFYELSRDMVKNRPDMPWVMITGNIMNFRLINTLFGVFKGNEVLVKTASLLKELTEVSRGLCGRLGGDQFAMLIPRNRYREEALMDIAGQLSEIYSSGMFTFCIHFGVYMIDDPETPVSIMCGRSNSALRTIREDMARTVAVFNDMLLQKILLEQKVIGGFEEALRDEQFQMYLQPQVDVEGRIFGAEALVRWRRPDGSLMMPGDFIETLEGAGLIHRLDIYMWEHAIRQLRAWQDTGKRDLVISVNISAKDFYSIDVYDVLTGLVDRYGVPCRLLRLEITETALLAEPEKSIAVVSRLRKRGFLVEIDDFGSGYSSLSLLKNIEADLLKIDMGFLREITDRQRSRVILKSVIELAESLGMDVITEGVETRQQLDCLAEMGCDAFQGYYFSRPIPVDAFEALLNANQERKVCVQP